MASAAAAATAVEQARHSRKGGGRQWAAGAGAGAPPRGGRSLSLLLAAAAALTLAGLPASATKTFAVAPMVSHTTRHFRAFVRTFSKDAVLYTEMVGADQLAAAARAGDAARVESLLGYTPAVEGPLVLQLGGRDPDTLHAAASVAVQHYGYTHLNLNCGCPSTAVAGTFASGAALMLEPEHAAACCAALADALASSPGGGGGGGGGSVSVKCRVGVDGTDYALLHRFVDIVSTQGGGSSGSGGGGGVTQFQIHARSALLDVGTMANRDVPPLQYDRVHRLAQVPYLAPV